MKFMKDLYLKLKYKVCLGLIHIKCPYRFKKVTQFEKSAKECRHVYESCLFCCSECGKRKKLKKNNIRGV